MTNHVFEKDGSWFFIDETQSHSYGPFWNEEEAKQEMELYNSIELLGSVKKIDFPKLDCEKYGLDRQVWDWYDGPLIGTYEDEQGTCLFCMWDQSNAGIRKFLSFRDSDGFIDRVKDFYKNGHNKNEAPPVITFILRMEKPIAWFELS